MQRLTDAPAAPVLPEAAERSNRSVATSTVAQPDRPVNWRVRLLKAVDRAMFQIIFSREEVRFD